jgi:membrane-associated protease RseP (regulator of RpoE activity)
MSEEEFERRYRELIRKNANNKQAGIIIGDIITHCDDKPIHNPGEMAAALTAIAADANVKIAYVRLHQEGYFSKAEISIEGKPLGVQFVGI